MIMVSLKTESSTAGYNLKFYQIILIACLLFCLVLPGLVTSDFYQDIIILVVIFACASQGYNIIGGYAGQFSLGHAAFFGIGAYTSTLLYHYQGLSPWIGMIIGGLLAALAGALTLYPSFRLRGSYFCLSTIAVGQIAWILCTFFRGLTYGGTGVIIENKPSWANFIFTNKATYYYISLTLLFIATLLNYLIRNTRLGSQLIALREEEDAAESLGINTSWCKLKALMLSAFITAIAGSILAQYHLYVHPDSFFSLATSIQFALISVIGGIGTVFGSILGALLIIPSDSLFRAWLGSRWAGAGFIIYGLLLICVVRFMPQGVAGILPQSLSKSANALYIAAIGIKRRVWSRKNEPAKIKKNFLTEIAIDNTEKMSKKILEVSKLSKSFSGVAAVENVNFSLNYGERLGIIGPNGAGKTTLFNLITGFLQPSEGKILFEGRNITKTAKPHQVAVRGIGRTFQVVKPFPELTVYDNLISAASVRYPSMPDAKDASLEMLDFAHLKRFQNSYAKDLPIGALKQLELGRSLLTKPKLLMLDEVMGGLNPKEIHEIISLIMRINRKGVSILLIEHIMRVIMSVSQRIIVLDHGEKIAEGTPEQISKNKKVIEAYLGKDFVDAGVQ